MRSVASPPEDVKGRGIANCSKFASAPRDNRISFRRITRFGALSEGIDNSPSGFSGRPQLTRKTAIIIGNGKLENDLSGVVDDAQFVMRFNKPNLADDMSGSRTDMLMLVASSNALHRRMIDPGFLENAAL